MEYKELQKQAKDLGLKASGKKEEIEARIEEFKSVEEPQVAIEEPKEEAESSKDDVSEAVVFNGKEEVRVYSVEKHGEDFKELAKEFVSNPKRSKYRIELR